MTEVELRVLDSWQLLDVHPKLEMHYIYSGCALIARSKSLRASKWALLQMGHFVKFFIRQKFAERLLCKVLKNEYKYLKKYVQKFYLANFCRIEFCDLQK